jgi:hypothetical protein
MANMWSGKDYWKHFVGFADRSNAAGITESNLENARTFEVISGDKRTLHGTKDKRSDTSKLQYGTNYTEQYGDSISVQEGNKSAIQSQGWSNSVMNGISFSTTSGGSVASTGGFSIATHVGSKVATFIGVELAMNESIAFKVAGGWVQEVFKTTKADVIGEHISLIGTATKIFTSVNETVGSFRRVSLVDDDISGERSSSSLAEYHRVSGLYSVSAAVSEENVGQLDVNAVSISQKAAAKIDVVAPVQSYDGLLKMG